jgi:hypothetical protein
VVAAPATAAGAAFYCPNGARSGPRISGARGVGSGAMALNMRRWFSLSALAMAMKSCRSAGRIMLWRLRCGNAGPRSKTYRPAALQRRVGVTLYWVFTAAASTSNVPGKYETFW